MSKEIWIITIFIGLTGLSASVKADAPGEVPPDITFVGITVCNDAAKVLD